MKWYSPDKDGNMLEVLEPKGAYVSYVDHLAVLKEVERLAEKNYIAQSDSYWKIEYDRLIEKYGHLFMGII